MAASIQIYGLKCFTCGFISILTDGDPDFVAVPLQSLKCPKCDSVTIEYVTDPGAGDATPLSAADMRKAFSGFGLPGESAISEDILRDLFVNVGVWSVNFDSTPKDRILIRCIIFNNGKKVWLAPSGLGVAALKITTGEKDGKR